ncbi:MAG: S-layer homology domain-containing protein [Clostridia bacterium]|nr:S-layer homology domain-containing protein [Clostridia bacterium]
MKKLLCLFLAILTVAATFPLALSVGSADSAFPFTDVKEEAWYRPEIEFVWEKGLMEGVSATKFEPSSTMTRAMFVTILCRLSGDETSVTDRFSDVKPNAWYAPYVGWAAKTGLVLGYPDGTFRPGSNITRQEAAATLVRFTEYAAMRLPGHAATSPQVFSDDEKIASWAAEYVDTLRKAGIFNGDANGRFNPSSNITRAEAATLLHNILKIVGRLWNGYVPDPDADGMAVYGAKYLYWGGFALQGKIGTELGDDGEYPYLDVFPDDTYADPDPLHVNTRGGGTSVSPLSYEPLGTFGFSPTNLLADLNKTPIVKICYQYVGEEPGSIFPGYVSDRHGGSHSYRTAGVTFEPGEDDAGWKTAICDTTDVIGALSLNFDPHTSACNVHVMIRPFDGAPEGTGFRVRYIALFATKEAAEANRCDEHSDYLKNYHLDEYAEVEKVGDDTVNEYIGLLKDKIAEIKNSPSAFGPEDAPEGATVWYVSSIHGDDDNDGMSPDTPFATPEGLYRKLKNGDETIYMSRVKSGDYVFFERGSVFYPWRYFNHGGGTLMTKNGAYYGAYGDPSAPKPVFTGSFDFGGGCGDWQPTEWEDVYVLDLLPLVPEGKENFALEDCDVGKIVFNGGEFTGVRVIPMEELEGSETPAEPFGEGKTTRPMYEQGNCDEYFMSGGTTANDPGDALRNNLEFINDRIEGKLYLRCKWGNPATYFKSVEVCRRIQPGWIDEDVHVDNLAFMYTSYVCAEIGNNCVVTNCEAGYGGGCIGSVGTGLGGYGECDSLTVDHCYIHDIADGPMGTQYTGDKSGVELRGVTLTNNVVVAAQNLVELFNDNRVEGPDGLGTNKIIGARVSGNIGAYIGYGYPRNVEVTAEGLAVHNWYFGEMVDCEFTNNTLICCEGSVIGAYVASDDNPRGWIMHHNTYILNPRICYILRGTDSTTTTNLERAFAGGYKMPYTERYLCYLNSIGIEYGTRFMSFDSASPGEEDRFYVITGWYAERGIRPR